MTSCTSRLNDNAKTPGTVIQRGDEVGRFEFGGSSIIVAFEPGRIKFDEDLESVAKRCVEMSVEVKDRLGVAARSG